MEVTFLNEFSGTINSGKLSCDSNKKHPRITTRYCLIMAWNPKLKNQMTLNFLNLQSKSHSEDNTLAFSYLWQVLYIRPKRKRGRLMFNTDWIDPYRKKSTEAYRVRALQRSINTRLIPHSVTVQDRSRVTSNGRNCPEYFPRCIVQYLQRCRLSPVNRAFCIFPGTNKRETLAAV